MSDVGRDLGRLEPELIAIRRDLHRHPEMGFAEERTAGIAAESMRRLGLTVRTGLGGTGVIADLAGERPGPRLLIRADMDALPIQETSGVDYRSTVPGVMHACGHDAHVAALIGAATLLSERRAQLAGSVRFAFQPAEEKLDGAPRMIADGALEGVDRALAAHVFSSIPPGMVAAHSGDFMAGADAFELRIIGQAGHGGMPQTAIDPVYAAAQVVTALQSVVARETRPGEMLVVSITSIEGGKAFNVVVDTVTLRGTVRWFTPAERERALERVQTIADGVCHALRARAEFEILGTVPVTSNSAAELNVVARAVEATGRAVVFDPGPITGSEDFSYFLNEVPGCLVGIGCGGPGAAPQHHHAFDIDESSIGLTAEIFTRAALEMLNPDPGNADVPRG